MKIKFPAISEKILGHLMFAVLFLLAALFYLERTIFVDPCYAIFNLTYYHDFVVEAGRKAAVLPQWPALLAIAKGWPLKQVLFIYSLSFIVLYYLVYLVIAHVFRLGKLALAVPLVFMLGIKYSFFWISTETHQAVVYTILFYAFLTWSLRFPKGFLTAVVRVVVAAGLLGLCFYSHPVALFTVLFALGYYMIGNRRWNRPDGYILAAIIVALAVYKFMTGSSVGYESFYFKGFGEFFDRLGYVFHSESFKFLRHNLFTIYLFPLLIFAVMIRLYYRGKQWLRLAWYAGYFVLFALVLFTTFDIWYFPFIQEKNLMGLTLVVLIPFLAEINPESVRNRRLMLGFLSLAFLVGTFHVVHALRSYKDHLAYVGELITTVRQFPEKKFILRDDQVDRNRLNVFWGLGPESLVLSSLKGPDSSVVIYVNDAVGRLDSTINLADTAHFIFVPWAKDLEVGRLDRRYFNLSGSHTRELTGQDLVSGGEKVIYENGFNGQHFRDGKDSCRTGSDGNIYFETSSEFSPGLYGKYSDVSRYASVMITATARVKPLEPLNPKWLAFVISREKDNKVLEYHLATLMPPDSLKVGQWNTFTVSGRISSTDPADLLKVYLWNPEKKRVSLDDLRVTCRKMQ